MLTKFIILTLFISFLHLSGQDVNYTSSKSKAGNIELIINNLGQVGYSKNITQSGFVWPRGSDAQYIYGSGLAVFTKLPNGENRNLYTYHPNTSKSDFTIGSHTDNSEITDSKYRVYNSRDYDKYSGIALYDSLAEYRWPIWTGNTLSAKTYGNYIVDSELRSRSVSKPNFRADEETVSIVMLDSAAQKSISQPGFEDLQLDIETRTYTYDEISDVLFVNWVVHNRGDTGLDSIALAPIFDVDITNSGNRFSGVDNDIMILPKDSSFALFATAIGDNEKDTDFGYIVFDWFTGSALESKEEITSLDFYSYYDFNLSTDYDSYDYMEYVESATQSTTPREQNLFAPTHRFELLAGAKVRLTMQIMLFAGDEDYPEIENSQLESISSDLDANWELFKSKVLTRVADNKNSNNLILYPNPTSSFINIDAKYSNQLVEIVSLSGKVVHTSIGTDRIDITSLQSGSYILRIDDLNQKFVVE